MSTGPEENHKGDIRTEARGGEFHVIIANERRLNAMSLAMWEKLASVINSTNEDNDIRVVILSGEGHKAFAAGADISEFRAHRGNPEQIARFDAAVGAATQAASNCRHPTVAIIRGICMGGGMSMAVACDLRYCTYRSRFRMPAGRVGLGYDREGVRRFVNTVGAARTAELFFTARAFDGREAARIGLVHESFEDDAFDAMAAQRIDAIKHLAPLTLRAAKLAIRYISNEVGAPSAASVEQAIGSCFLSDDYQEGQLAFLEKREPKFSGR